MIPSEPPKIDMKLPPKLKRHLEAMRVWMRARQPIGGQGINASENPQGIILDAAAAGMTEEFTCIRFGGVKGIVTLYVAAIRNA